MNVKDRLKQLTPLIKDWDYYEEFISCLKWNENYHKLFKKDLDTLDYSYVLEKLKLMKMNVDNLIKLLEREQ